MIKRILLIENEIEWLEVINVLESNGISFNEIKTSDSTFPSLSGNDKFEIIIAEEDYDELVALVGREYPWRQVEISPESNSGISRTKIALIGYSILMTMLFLKYFNMNQRDSVDKNYEYSWSYDNKILIQKHKENKELYSKWCDHNFDNNHERIESFFRGVMMSEVIDKNEDGILDKETFYDLQGNFSGYQIDTDGDGLMDKALTILENGDTLKFIDKNRNGLFELE